VTHRQVPTRREFVRSLGAGAAALLVAPVAAACRSGTPNAALTRAGAAGWELVPEILARIKPPTFPQRDFEVTRFGAVGDGMTDCSTALGRAIGACAEAGGGRVVVPPGRFLTGPVHLSSNTNLYVARGGTLAFNRDPKAYLPGVRTRFEGTELINYSPLVYAFDQENVAVTGEGTLDGQADATRWWWWKGSKQFGWTEAMPNYNASRQRLLKMAEDGVPVPQRTFGEGDYLRPSFIQPYQCRNVLIEGVTIRNSPMWEIHPVLCRNVTVRRVTIDTLGPNNDGCNPESCRDVLIDNCTFTTGDDCIAIKSGRNADGRRINVPSENIIVRNSRMRDGHGGVSIGSEISGGVRNVFVHDCQMDSPRLERALRLKTNAMRGGVLEHVYMRDVTVGEVAEAVLSIDFNYEEGAKGTFMPTVRDIEMRHVTSAKSSYALYLRGFEADPIVDVRVIDCSFARAAKPNVIEYVKGLALTNTTINGTAAS
jgi:polygalacturonase